MMGEAQSSGIFSMLLPFIMMFAVIYLLIIRPQRKQKIEHEKMLHNLKVNDKVVTNSGIIAKIVSLKEDKNIVVLRIDEATNTKMEVQKSSIATVISNEEPKCLENSK